MSNARLPIGPSKLRVALALIFLISVLPIHGQSTFGSLVGTVKDPAGRIVPGASLLLINDGTSAKRQATTDGSGSYTFVNLEPGQYTLTIQAEGFAKQEFANLQLQSREVKRVDADLKIGAQASSVTVSGSAEGVITTDDSSIAQNKTSKELTDLPVAIYSRSQGSTSAFSTLTTQAGVQTDGTNLVIAGATPALQSFTLDGISTLNVEYSGPLTELFPSFNSISEIRVGESNNNAEFSGVVDVTTTSKSGTNDLHGGLFLNEQNTALNAGNPFAVTKPTIHMHNFGAYAGGPIVIPHLYDGHNKTFFFASYEGLRLPKQTPMLISVPSLAMRSGNLCSYLAAQGVSQINDPHGNQIPCASVPVSPVAQNVMNEFFPLPNLGSADAYQNNYQQNVDTPITTNQGDLRIDQTINQRQTMFGRFTYRRAESTQSPENYGSPVLGQIQVPEKDSALTVAHNFVIRPTLVNEIRFGYSSYDYKTAFNANPQQIIPQLGITGIPDIPSYATVPDFTITGFQSTGGGSASEQRSRTVQLIDNLSWAKGKHSFKFGGQVQRLTYSDNNVFGNATPGTYIFDGSSAVGGTIGDPYTSFLLGYPDFVTLALVSDPGMNGLGYAYAVYAQDDWKVTSKLTLNVGLRYELHQPLSARQNNTAAFLPNYTSTVNGQTVNGAVVVPNQQGLALVEPGFAQSIYPTPILTASQAGIPESLRYTNKTDFGPRIGFAWRPFAGDNTVIRGGYGRFIETPLGYSSYTGWAVATSYIGNYPQAYDGSGNPTLAFPSPFPPGLYAPGLANFYIAFPLHYIDPSVQQWNLTFEQNLGKNLGLRLTYTGNHGSNLDLTTDLNQVHPNTLGYSAVGGNRPYPQWGIIDCICNTGFSNYNSFTAELSRHYSNGLQFDASYVWTRDLSNSAGAVPNTLPGVGGALATDRFNTSLDYGNVSFDRRHRFLATFLYDLPIGRGRQFVNTNSRALDAVVNNWQLGGVVLFQSGAFLTPFESSTDPAGTNILNFIGETRTDFNRNVSPYADAYVGGFRQWLNPSAFPIPADNIGRFGNLPVGAVTGPGTQSVSLSLIKTFNVTERWKMQVGAQAANVLNHRNYDVPNLQVDSGAFGTITGLQSAEGAGPRMIMLAARVTF